MRRPRLRAQLRVHVTAFGFARGGIPAACAGSAAPFYPELNAARPARSGDRVEERLGRATGHDRVSHGVGVSLISIPVFADAALELDAFSLLDHVRGFVGRRVKIGRALERDVVSHRVRIRAERLARVRGSVALVRAHITDVVTAERALDAVLEGEGTSEIGRAAGSDCARVAGRVGFTTSSALLALARLLALKRQRPCQCAPAGSDL